jgi:NAD-dependent SIR2 family protein deacetylase
MSDSVPDDHPDRAYRCEECGADMPLSDCVYEDSRTFYAPLCPICGGPCWAEEGEMDDE